jgi:hypothetical protein
MTKRLQAIDFGPHGVAVFPAVDVAKEVEHDPNAVFDPLLAFKSRPRPAAKAVQGDENGVLDGVFSPVQAFFAPRG